MQELQEMLRALQIFQPMRAEITRPDIGVGVADQLRCGEREHDLPAVRRGHDPCAAIERSAEIVLTTHLDRSGVQAHPHPERADLRPRLGLERALAFDRRANGGDRIAERGIDRITDGLEHDPAGLLHRGSQELVMSGDRDGVPAGMCLEHPGARLDIGEQEGDRSGGQIHRPRLAQAA